ncbi:MAG: FAD-dependent oxidoreductase [Planctomycetota bacterium]
MTVHDCDVLVVGAGPTGLTLALWLRRLGVDVCIVDAAASAGTSSRAFAVQARTLELHDQVGVAAEALARGVRIEALNMWAGGQSIARVPLRDVGAGLGPYPFVLALAQDDHERLLEEALRATGTEVVRSTAFRGLVPAADHVLATFEGPDGVEAVSARFVCGCDGAHSAVREQIGVGFPGGTYERLFFVADVTAKGPTSDGEVHVCLREEDFTLVFPVRLTGTRRLIGLVPERLVARGADLRWEDVARSVMRDTHLDVSAVHWFATYHSHHRVADSFRLGRVFLLGDAAHIHSPAGGQGLNTGVGDAVNLAWKLAHVLHGRAPARLLDTYEPERIAFARRLVATTDRLFQGAVSPSPLARFVRFEVVPRLWPRLLRIESVRRAFFRLVSQIGIEYHDSPLSEGVAGGVRGGDRLPWVRFHDGDFHWDNFEELRTLDWQLHVYGEAGRVAAHCAERGVQSYEFPWTPEVERAGFERGAHYLVRPDGYVALADARVEPLFRYLDRWIEARVPEHLAA